MYNCPKCEYGTNVPVEFRNHLKEQHPDIENPDLAYLHAGEGPGPLGHLRFRGRSVATLGVRYRHLF